MLAAGGYPQYPGTPYKPISPLGSYSATPQQVAQTLNWFSVSAGGMHTCAMRRFFNKSKHRTGADDFDHTNPDDAPGQLRCWGMNDYGQVHPLPLPFGEPPTDGCEIPANPSGIEKSFPNKCCTQMSENSRLIGFMDINQGFPGKELKVVQRDCWNWDDGWRNVSAGWLHNW